MKTAFQSKMDEMSRRSKMDLILTLIAHEAKRNTPDEFRAFVVATLANCVATMPEADFEKFCAVHRCDQPGCDCHVIAGEASKFFRLLRADVKNELSNRNLKRN